MYIASNVLACEVAVVSYNRSIIKDFIMQLLR